jgi:hypothetical protein
MFYTAAVALCLGLIAAPLTANADACSDMTLKGTFGFTFTTTPTVVKPDTVEVVGLFEFDGVGGGHVILTHAHSDGSVGGPDTESMTYSVAPNCTFTFLRVPSSESYSAVIVGNGQEFFFIETSSNILARGHAIRTHGAK